MGRWADQDDDEHRLPHGFQRVGYDADTQTYTYQDASGRYWNGEEGNRHGVLHPAGRRPAHVPSASEAEEPQRGNREAIRMMLPFALLVIVVMLLLFKFINGGNHADDVVQVAQCAESARAVQVQKGQTCWAIAEAHGVGVEELLGLEGNGNVDCDHLGIGQSVCVPKSK